MEGSWDQLDLSEVKIDQYFEDEDEQGYVREKEELEDIYEDDELSEMEAEESQKSLKLVRWKGWSRERGTKSSHLMRL